MSKLQAAETVLPVCSLGIGGYYIPIPSGKRPGWLILLILLGFACNLADAAICRTIVREHVSGFSMAKALDVTYLSVFGNVITLAAGSVPMQALILYRFATYCLFL